MKMYVHVCWLACLLERLRMFRRPVDERDHQALATGHLLVKLGQDEIAAFYPRSCVSIILPLFTFIYPLMTVAILSLHPPLAW